MRITHCQPDLFPQPDGLLPAGWRYQADFLSSVEEELLLGSLDSLTLEPAQYRGYIARRRILHFGLGYDFGRNASVPAAPMPVMLAPLRGRVAAWCDVPPEMLRQALITLYEPGVPIGWHRDVPDYGVVAGVSLLGNCRMLLRPYTRGAHRRGDVISVTLARRSIYGLQDAARWNWQHSIPPVAGRRYSITFRTLRNPPSAG